MVGKLRNDFDSMIYCYFSKNLILMTFAVANNRNTSIKDRANSALTTVQHNNYAMNILRLRLSSGISFIISCKGKPQHYQGSVWVLELVKVPLTIFDNNKSNAVSSISEVKDDVEQRVESAEASLSELHNAISKVSALLLPELRQEIEPELLAWASTMLAAGKTDTAGFMTNEAALTGAVEREEEEEDR
jgi:hypothetical protein